MRTAACKRFPLRTALIEKIACDADGELLAVALLAVALLAVTLLVSGMHTGRWKAVERPLR